MTMNNPPREITALEQRMLGFLMDEHIVMAGHPLTCNGGNPDQASHHDHEVLMLIEHYGLLGVRLHCPECGRVQEISSTAAGPDPVPPPPASNPRP